MNVFVSQETIYLGTFKNQNTSKRYGLISTFFVVFLGGCPVKFRHYSGCVEYFSKGN